MAVVVEHGTFGRAAPRPIARDVMTCLFKPEQAWADLLEMEKTWGGTPAERLAKKYAAFAAQYGTSAPSVASDEVVDAAIKQVESSEPSVATTGVTTEVERGEATSTRSAGPAAAPSSGASNAAQATPGVGGPN
jgi:penicillin-binding protein 2